MEVWRGTILAAVIGLVVLLPAGSAFAQQCGLSVSVSNGVITATVSGGQCGHASVYMHRDDRSFVVNTTCYDSSTCSASYDTACLDPRPYTFTVGAHCGRSYMVGSEEHCAEESAQEQTVSLSVDPTPPAVTVSHTADPDGHGSLSVAYSFPPGSRQINLYLDGSSSPFTSAGGFAAPQGVWDVPFDVTCWSPGPHVVKAVAFSCNRQDDPRYMSEDETVIVVDNEPDVSLAAAPSTGGNVTFTADYQFRNTLARRLDLYVDGTLRGSETNLARSGSWNVEAPVGACWESAKVVATACGQNGGPAYTSEAEIKAEERRPAVEVTLLRVETDPQSGRRRIYGEVRYDMRAAGTEPWNVRAWVSRYIDINGVETPGDTELTLTPSTTAVSGLKTFDFEPEKETRQVWVMASASSCVGETTDDAFIECDCDASNGGPGASFDPVYFNDGNMMLADTDPLPPVNGRALVRTYNSDEQVAGLFGRGWTTVFNRRLTVYSEPAGQRAMLLTETNEAVAFRKTASGPFRQTWPKRQASFSTLTLDIAAGHYVYRGPGASEVSLFRVSDGRLVAIRELGTGREARITYDAAGVPATLSDSWTGLTWTLTTVGGRMQSIAVVGRPDLSWSYVYDPSGNLITVLAPGGGPWRTYEYTNNRMTASRDAAGNLIESHQYANGYAIDSTGPQDEIESIEYNRPGPGQLVTTVTMKTGAVTDYVMRPAGGAYRVVQIIGSCPTCGGGSGDRTYVRDSRGRVTRDQRSDGYVDVLEYEGDHLIATERHLAPAGCDPSTTQCRMNTDALAAAELEATDATIRTEYVYDDPVWPERATSIRVPSVLSAGTVRTESSVYHPVTGETLQRSTSGLAGTAQAPAVRQDTTTLYEPPNGLAPAFEPGGTYQAVWLTLAQPSYLPKRQEGPRPGVEDATSFVYYPVDPASRLHIAAGWPRCETARATSHATRAMTSSGTSPGSSTPTGWRSK